MSADKKLRELIDHALTIYKPAPFKDAEPLKERRANEKQIDEIMTIIAQQNAALKQSLEYEKQVADNVRLLANVKVPGTLLDPSTNAKVYNQAYIDELKQKLIEAIPENGSVVMSREAIQLILKERK